MNKIVLTLALIVTLAMKSYADTCATSYCLSGNMCAQGQSVTCSCSDEGPTYSGNAACVLHNDAGVCGATGLTCQSTATCDYSACTQSGPPPSSVGPCLPGTICGTVLAAEGDIALAGIRVLLIDPSTSKTVQSALTDASGSYAFTLPMAQAYTVVVPAGRRQLVTPPQMNLSETFAGNFTVRGIPAHLNLSGLKPGTFVLVSGQPYQAANPPSIQSGMAASYYSRTAGPDGSVHVDVPAGTGYVVTCWVPGAMQAYARVQSQALAQTLLVPESTVTATCQ